jgi:hypothetical protein
MGDDLIERPGSEGMYVTRRLIEQMRADITALKRMVYGMTETNGADSNSTPTALFLCRVISSTVLSTNHNEYSVKRIKGGASSHSGIVAYGEVLKARDADEEQARGGYISSAVTAIQPIAAGKIVICWWGSRKDGSDVVPQLLFARDNEPIC